MGDRRHSFSVKFITCLHVFYCCLNTVYCQTDGYCQSKDECPNHDVKLDDLSWTIKYLESNKDFLVVDIPDILQSVPYESCMQEERDETVKICLNWKRYGKLRIGYRKHGNVNCHNVIWTPLSYDFTPIDCLSMTGANWYGGSELHTQRWPLQEAEIPMQPFLSQDSYIMKNFYGNVLEAFWVNSNGVGVVVKNTTPLHVGINQNKSKKLCFKAEFSGQHFNPEPGKTYPILNYTVCKSNNVKSTHQFMYNRFFEKPTGVPDVRMLKSPIWSTWAKYKTLINQSSVLEYAKEISEYGFSNSQLEIDDMFSTKYGDFDFDTNKFPDAAEMIKNLKAKGYRVTAWITPFANLDSYSFDEGLKMGYWLTDKQGNVPALVSWWQGVGAIIDVTNMEAVDWYVSRLEKMKETYDIDSFKFDAGEMTYLPSSYKTNRVLENSGLFTKLYVDAVSRLGNMIEVRCGYNSQKYPVFVRMADKDSKWGYDNGLRTLIPVALTMGILGYPFVLPDMIGGNGYGEHLATDVVLPERELYIRWLQLSAFMPSMQFSFVPWQYDSEVVAIAKQMVEIHENRVVPILLKAAKETLETGAPLIRPLWWNAPDDDQAQIVDSEFMVGDDILVAPVLQKGADQRDVYLPAGKWKNDLTGGEINGGKWIKGVKADLRQIPTFTHLK
ncbi:hypothetical protein KUTeg_022544 [Tegillarca granosa]|uniref:Uncharacterized protein n=1 Tax=Tegillarca granosa TaxID=220873 RepID=A0ABQ9E7A0_TEGGR|nr:hypothetical protein KUTeg_022544 [Tegillarca granosa]